MQIETLHLSQPLVDQQVEKMIATLKEKASHEKESLTEMLSDCKEQLENAKAIKENLLCVLHISI
jgi:phage-related minor tail protein